MAARRVAMSCQGVVNVIGRFGVECSSVMGSSRMASAGSAPAAVLPSVLTACVVSLQFERLRPSFDECHMIPVHDLYQIAAALESLHRGRAADDLTPRIG